jgi:thioester reductase-like protein
VADKISRQHKSTKLFSVKDLKAILLKPNGKPVEIHKAECEAATKEYNKKIEGVRKPPDINGKFFNDMYQKSKAEIEDWLKNCAQKQGEQKEEIEENSAKKIRKLSKENEKKSMEKIEKKIQKKSSKGAHWDNEEKELFVQCLEKYGKDWASIAHNFPKKTSKQLRNYFQNNKARFGLFDHE